MANPTLACGENLPNVDEAIARYGADAFRYFVLREVPFDADTFRYRGASRERCYALFSQLGFRTLVPEFAPTAASVVKDYALVGSSGELQALVEQLRAAQRFSLKVITDGTAPVRATLVGIAVSTGAAMARYIPLGHEGFGGAGFACVSGTSWRSRSGRPCSSPVRRLTGPRRDAG